MSSGIREGRWLCENCGAICLGRYESCNGDGTPGMTGCGVARPKTVRFFSPKNSPYVTDSALLADAKSGVDWHCDHCDGANKGSVAGHRVVQCVHCGNARDAGDTDTKVRDFKTGEAPASVKDLEVIRKAERTQHINAARARRGEPPLNEVRPERTGHKKGPLLIWGAVASFASLFCLLLWSFLATTPYASRVSEQSWNRSIDIQRFATLQETGWDHPSDARILSRETRQRTTEQVLVGYRSRTVQETERYVSGSESYVCGERDLGNGYFQDITCDRNIWSSRQVSRQVQDPIYETRPVMGTWFRYEIDRWVHARTLRTSGTDPNRLWPEVPVLGSDERQGGRSEALRVVITHSDGVTEQRALDEAEWLRMPTGTNITAYRNFWGTTRSMEIR